MNPDKSANSTVADRRSASDATGAAGVAVASLLPQRGQNAKSTDASSWQRWHCIDGYYAWTVWRVRGQRFLGAMQCEGFGDLLLF
ncbi:MAG TPA: hypothetical protein VMT14_09580 [Burkholderiaceae bacterium]|nr:hypothetical protein [Burkholderiaceae bacterium]